MIEAFHSGFGWGIEQLDNERWYGVECVSSTNFGVTAILYIQEQEDILYIQEQEAVDYVPAPPQWQLV